MGISSTWWYIRMGSISMADLRSLSRYPLVGRCSRIGRLSTCGLPLLCKKVRVLEERGAGTECRHYEPRQPVAPTRENHVLTEKAPSGNPGQVPGASPASACVKVFSTPSGITNHFLEMVREVAVGLVLNLHAKRPDVVNGFETFMHTPLDETPIMGEQPHVPVSSPVTVPELTPQIDVPKVDTVRCVLRCCQHCA